MRIIQKSFFAVLILAAILPSVIRAQGFEGIVTWETSVPLFGDQKIVMTVSIKGDKSVTYSDIPNMGSMKTYYNKKANTSTIVYEAQKRGMEMDLTQLDNASKNKKFSDPKNTGKKETIKGYTAEEYTSSLDSTLEFDMWLTKDMPKDITAALNTSMQTSMQLGGTKNDSFKELFNKGYTPLRLSIKKDGEVQAVVEFSKVEPKKLDDAVFIIPADVQIQKIDPAMMQQMQQQGDGN